ncbi:MAG TPA: hypothetical protein PLZ36_04215 [Armatimonadota bacterium]|nr:hypothetical protein [Armatimonadota bacterium]
MTEKQTREPEPSLRPPLRRRGTKAQPEVPWYTVNPRHLRFSKFTWWVIGLGFPLILLFTVSIKPLWCWGWHAPFYSYAHFLPVADAAGRRHRGGEWVRAKEIIVYGMPGTDPRDVQITADGLQDLVNELNLDFTVRLVEAPPKAVESWRAALTPGAGGEKRFNMDRFEARRLAERQMQYGEMVLIDAEFTNPTWAWGLSSFRSGISVVRAPHCGIALSRHEGAHLLGYDRHDDMPLYIIGYREGAIPALRDTLMMLKPTSSMALSDRAFDALHAFWLGLEDRHGTQYFRSP